MPLESSEIWLKWKFWFEWKGAVVTVAICNVKEKKTDLAETLSWYARDPQMM